MNICSQSCCTVVMLHMLSVPSSLSSLLLYNFWIHFQSHLIKWERYQRKEVPIKQQKTRAWTKAGDPIVLSEGRTARWEQYLLTCLVWLPAGKEQTYPREPVSTTWLKTGHGTCCSCLLRSWETTGEETRVCEVFQAIHGNMRSWETVTVLII